jgi:hypothetical protein
MTLQDEILCSGARTAAAISRSRVSARQPVPPRRALGLDGLRFVSTDESMDRQMAEDMARRAGTSVSRLGLRFDRVVLRILSELSEHCDRVVPDDARVLVTISAPIRLPARTADELKQRIESLVLEGAPREQVTNLHENTVCVRLVRAAPRSQPRLLGLVHNPGMEPRALLELAERYAERVLRPEPRCP